MMTRRDAMKLALAISSVSVLGGISGVAHAATEGEDYVVLDKPFADAQGTLTKVFSYDCPFCYKYDVSVDPKLLPRVEKELGLKFNPVHLETKAKYGKVATEFLVVCMLRDKANARSIEAADSLFKKAKDALYDSYHKKGERWTAGEAAILETLVGATQVSLEDFNKERATPQVKQVMDAWHASYDIAKIQGIPAYVVNGKYLIMTKSIRSLNGMFDLIKELMAKP